MLLTCIPYSQVVCDAGCSCLIRIVYSTLLPWEEGYIGMCGPKGYGFLDVLVRTRVLISAILVSTRVWFLHTSLELVCFVEDVTT